MGSDWYRDEDALLSVIRDGAGATQPVPVIRGYDNLQELRRGGQGIIYTATQTSTKRKVAIKVLLGGAFATERDRRRFEREIDLAASLRHPSIVRLYDSGLTDERSPFFVMEFIEGLALDELLGSAEDEHGRPYGEIRSTVEMFAKVCDAVTYAHRHAVIHRDLKPSNIRIDAAGQPHVLDFGLARSSGETYATGSSEMRVSLTGEFMGSLPWASPEQAAGDPGRIDVRTDVYALGVVLYQLLTGRFPYGVTGPFRDVLDNVMRKEAVNPRHVRAELDDELATIVLKCLEKDPERRYQGAADLARDLRHYLAGEPIDAKRDSAWYAIRKRLRQYRIAARIGSAFVLLSLVFSLFMLFAWQRAVQAESQANVARAAEEQARRQADRDAATVASVNRLLRTMLATPVDKGREARVVDVLEPALLALNQRDDLDPATEASMLLTIGAAFSSLGMYDKADGLIERALQLSRGTHGDAHEETLLVRSHEAWVTYLQGNLGEAIELYRRLLEDRRRISGPEHPQTGVVMNDLALVLEMNGVYDESLALYRASLELLQDTQGEQSRDALTAIGNVGNVLHAMGRLDEAEALMRRRLEMSQDVLGDEHTDTWTAMNNLGVLLLDRARYTECVRLFSFVHERRARQRGDDNIDTLRIAQNLAFAYAGTGDRERALEILTHAADAMTRQYGADHPTTLTIQANVAAMLSELSRFADAAAIERDVLDITRRVYGDAHVQTHKATANLASSLMRLDEWADAVALLGPTVAQLEIELGNDHPHTLTSKSNLVLGLQRLGRLHEAEQAATEVLTGRTHTLGPDHPDTLQAVWNLADLALERGRQDEAVARLSELRTHAARVLAPDHWYRAIIEGRYGKCLLVTGRYDEAEGHLLAAQEALAERLGTEHSLTQAQLGRLTWLYEELDQPERAAGYRALLGDAERTRLRDERAKYRDQE